MELRLARYLAAEVAQLTQPYCARVQQAGSIRREVPEVKDLELVVIPKWEERPGMDFSEPPSLFETATERRMVKVNLLHEAMMKIPESEIHIEWIKPGTSTIEPWPIKADGKYWRGLVAGADGNGPLQPIKLDLFIANPDNYGVIFAVRTGSADFSRALVTYARDKTPYRVQEGYLIDDQQIGRPKIACPDEQTLFGLLELEYVEPRFRRSERDIRPL